MIADYRGRDLRGRDFRRVDLSFADFTGADLRDADFTGAILTGAKISSVDLSRTRGITSKHDKPFEIELSGTNCVAYKVVTQQRLGVYYPVPAEPYLDGKVMTAPTVMADIESTCGHGINVATLAWCAALLKTIQESILIRVLFQPSDLVVIPRKSDGKYRVSRCYVEGEMRLA